MIDELTTATILLSISLLISKWLFFGFARIVVREVYRFRVLAPFISFVRFAE